MFNERYELPQYSRSKIVKAGKVISNNDEGSPEFMEYLPVVDNWRASHAYALDVISGIVSEVIRDDENSFVVHRLKRLDSIIGKLKRTENTGLFRMQDLGGCRVVVDELDKVFIYVGKIKEDLIKHGHEIVKEYNYIERPRSVSGYRSHHIVVKFHCTETPLFDNMLIEIQIRTKLEHVWATAVEMMDIISEETLKAGTGKTEYMRFFKLVSALFSISEKTPVVEGVDNNEEVIIEEIYEIDRLEHIRDKLATYNQALQLIDTNRKDDDKYGYYLLIINRIEHTIRILPFEKDNVERATTAYQELEKEKKKNREDVVLISVNSIENITAAYPNYFLMTYDFLARLAKLCSKYPEKSKLHFSSMNKGKRIMDDFSVVHVKETVPNGVRVSPSTLGAKEGDINVAPSYNMTLDDSYLRLSAPIWDEQIFYDENSEENVEMIPHTVQGAGIIITLQGGCYYCNKPEWSYLCQEDSLIVQSKNQDTDSLLVLLSWMKSNVFAWDLLWNYHSITAFPKKVFSNLWYPDLSIRDRQRIIQITKEIIKMEYDFVDKFVDEGFESNVQIAQFNKKISNLLGNAEEVYCEFYGLTSKDKEIVQQELSIKGFYTYE